MKVPQWCVFNWLVDAATQSLDCDETITQFGVESLVLGLKECENSHTLATTFKNSQKEPNNLTDNQSSVLCPQRSLLFRFLLLDEVKYKPHSQQQSQLMTTS